MTPARISTRVGKTDALTELGRRAGLGSVEPYAVDLEPLFAALAAALRPEANDELRFATAAECGLTVRTLMPARQHRLAQPRFCNGRPDSFPHAFGLEDSPAFTVAEIPGGRFVQIGLAPVALLADQAAIVTDYSSRYAELARYYDFHLAVVLADARRLAGDVLVLCDDIAPVNYCHWLVDTLPRLAFLGARRDVTVVISERDVPFRRETLRACGIGEDRIVALPDFAAIRAERLLVPGDCRAMPHPAYKAAFWALDFLRSRIGMAATRPAGASRLYVSRDDASGRRVLNEDTLMRLLSPLGYHRVTLAGRSVAEQVALFAAASHVVGLHGAGLTNVVFCPSGGRLLEILPASYGMPSYYLLATGGGMEYASYLAHDVRPGSRDQVDDVALDIGDFARCCASLL